MRPSTRRGTLGGSALLVVLVVLSCKLDASGVDLPGPYDGGAQGGDDTSVSFCGQTPIDNAHVAGFTSKSTKTIDGDLSDWGCETALSFPPSELDVFAAPADSLKPVRAEVRVEWDPSALYVGVRVTDDGDVVGSSTDPTQNDAVEVDVTGLPLAGTYHQGDHRFVVDVAGHVEDTGPAPAAAGTFQASVKNGTGSPWSMEMKIAASAFGKQQLASGDTLSIDFQLDDALATMPAAAFHVWAWKRIDPSACMACVAPCCCGTPFDYPSCDTLLFGGVVLR